MRDFPQFKIELPPNLVGSMIPGPAHIQGKLRQRIETIDLGGEMISSQAALA
jgi:hypothetical protein